MTFGRPGGWSESYLNRSHMGQAMDCSSGHWALSLGDSLMYPFSGVGPCVRDSVLRTPVPPHPSLLKAHHELTHNLPSRNPQEPRSECCMIWQVGRNGWERTRGKVGRKEEKGGQCLPTDLPPRMRRCRDGRRSLLDRGWKET